MFASGVFCPKVMVVEVDNATSGYAGRFATSLAPDPTSARTARRFLRARLGEAGVADSRIDDAELLVSELVTNAVVHAGSAIALAVNVFAHAVRVEVEDGSPAHPVSYRAPDTSTTGRGWDLVRMLADAYGVADSRSGKVTWFSLGPAPPLAADSPTPSDGFERGEPIVVREVPRELFAVWREHAAAAVREMTLIGFAQAAEGTSGDDSAIALRLADEAVGALRRADLHPPAGEVGGPAESRGGGTADVSMARRHDLAIQFDALPRVLDAAVTSARNGTMLVPPAPPEVIAFREWLCAEVVRQCEGEEPVPWSRAPRSTPSIEMPPVEWDVSHVTAAPTALVAADDTNRILAVSESAAALLGWAADALVGRRITTIIPERLHAAHVVGFLRHLLTGSTTIIGSQVTVPARRADGSEVAVDISIQPLPRRGGRTVFIAELQVPPPST